VRNEESIQIGLLVSDGDSLESITEKVDALSLEKEERALIEKIQSGKNDEYRHLVNRYKNLVYSMIMRQVSKNSLAEELSQEVFIKAFTNIKQFRFQSKFSTWLTRIALNHTNTFFSSKRYKIELKSESFDIQKHESQMGNNLNDKEQEENQARLLKNFRAALAKLKPMFREVLILCALEEKTYEEVSEILDVPIGTVRSRLNKARLLMRKLVEEIN
jgi:RNA polymerase sigma-70 factor, ECF subfamily